jgi:membrane protein YqaA with SNARE-associated domain
MSLLAVWLTTLGVAVASAVIPVINIEIYLLGAAALAPAAMAVPLVLAATIGQMMGKVVMYFAGTGAVKLPGKRLQSALEGMNNTLRNRPRSGGALVFASAASGFPPFFIVTVAAGAARMNLALFVVLGFLGRLVRFAVIVALPHLVKGAL